MKMNKFGSPEKPKMDIYTMPGYQHHPARVKDSVWSHEDKPWGDPQYPHKSQHSSIESHYLYRNVLKLGVGNYANLGVFRGGSTDCIAQGLKKLGGGQIYAVDLFQKINGAENVEDLIDIFKDRGTDKYTTFCEGYTHDWPARLKHLQFKFIFIDADHYYETCKQDFDLWSPLLEPEGVIAFHDVDFNTVNKFLEDELGDWELVDHVYRIKSFRKK